MGELPSNETNKNQEGENPQNNLDNVNESASNNLDNSEGGSVDGTSDEGESNQGDPSSDGATDDAANNLDNSDEGSADGNSPKDISNLFAPVRIDYEGLASCSDNTTFCNPDKTIGYNRIIPSEVSENTGRAPISEGKSKPSADVGTESGHSGEIPPLDPVSRQLDPVSRQLDPVSRQPDPESGQPDPEVGQVGVTNELDRPEINERKHDAIAKNPIEKYINNSPEETVTNTIEKSITKIVGNIEPSEEYIGLVIKGSLSEPKSPAKQVFRGRIRENYSDPAARNDDSSIENPAPSLEDTPSEYADLVKHLLGPAPENPSEKADYIRAGLKIVAELPPFESSFMGDITLPQLLSYKNKRFKPGSMNWNGARFDKDGKRLTYCNQVTMVGQAFMNRDIRIAANAFGDPGWKLLGTIEKDPDGGAYWTGAGDLLLRLDYLSKDPDSKVKEITTGAEAQQLANNGVPVIAISGHFNKKTKEFDDAHIETVIKYDGEYKPEKGPYTFGCGASCGFGFAKKRFGTLFEGIRYFVLPEKP